MHERAHRCQHCHRGGAGSARHGIGVDILHHWITTVLKQNPSAPCHGLETPTLMPVIDGLRSHPRRSKEDRSRLARVDGYLALREQRCEGALAAFNRRLGIQRRPEAVAEQIGHLAARCGDPFGLRHLQHFRAGAARGYARLHPRMLQLRDWLMQRQGYWERELGMLEEGLRAGAAVDSDSVDNQTAVDSQ